MAQFLGLVVFYVSAIYLNGDPELYLSTGAEFYHYILWCMTMAGPLTSKIVEYRRYSVFIEFRFNFSSVPVCH